MSIPLTLQELLTKLEQTNCTAVPEGRVTPAPAEDDQSAPTGATAAVPEDTIEVSACCTASVASTEPAPEINLSPAVNLYPSAPVAVFSQPVTAHCLNWSGWIYTLMNANINKSDCYCQGTFGS